MTVGAVYARRYSDLGAAHFESLNQPLHFDCSRLLGRSARTSARTSTARAAASMLDWPPYRRRAASPSSRASAWPSLPAMCSARASAPLKTSTTSPLGVMMWRLIRRLWSARPRLAATGSRRIFQHESDFEVAAFDLAALRRADE